MKTVTIFSKKGIALFYETLRQAVESQLGHSVVMEMTDAHTIRVHVTDPFKFLTLTAKVGFTIHKVYGKEVAKQASKDLQLSEEQLKAVIQKMDEDNKLDNDGSLFVSTSLFKMFGQSMNLFDMPEQSEFYLQLDGFVSFRLKKYKNEVITPFIKDCVFTSAEI